MYSHHDLLIESSDSTSDKENDRALLALGKWLSDRQYHFTTVTPETHRIYLQKHPAAAENLRDVFGWSKLFKRSWMDGEALELMRQAGVLKVNGETCQSAVRWSTLKNMLFSHAAYPPDAEDAVFFGPDTYRFVRMIEKFLNTDVQVKRAVDIGCGCGAGALVVARHFPDAQVFAVDINQQALRLTEVNARLANLNNVYTQQSNVLDEVEGFFDLVISNPPYMRDDTRRKYRHGGDMQGSEISLKIVHDAFPRLNSGGTLLLYTGACIVGGEDEFLKAVTSYLADKPCSWTYEEIDPDVFSEELPLKGYTDVERIAVVGLVVVHN